MALGDRVDRGDRGDRVDRGDRGLWEQFPGPQGLPAGIHQVPGLPLPAPEQPRAVGGFWGQIVKTNKEAESARGEHRGKGQRRSSQQGRRRAGQQGRRPGQGGNDQGGHGQGGHGQGGHGQVLGRSSGKELLTDADSSSSSLERMQSLLRAASSPALSSLHGQGVDRMGELADDYYEYLDDYSEDLGNVDMMEEVQNRPMDALEAHRYPELAPRLITLVVKHGLVATSGPKVARGRGSFL